jgi:hypothetical protein
MRVVAKIKYEQAFQGLFTARTSSSKAENKGKVWQLNWD